MGLPIWELCKLYVTSHFMNEKYGGLQQLGREETKIDVNDSLVQPCHNSHKQFSLIHSYNCPQKDASMRNSLALEVAGI